MKVITVPLPPIMTNCYIAYEKEGGKCFIIDPASSCETIINRIKVYNLKPKAILLTHGHFDHMAAADELRDKYKIPLYVHSGDADMITSPTLNCSLLFGSDAITLKPAEKLLEEGDSIKLENESLKVLHTPGHSQGSCVYLGGGLLFSGDTLFCNGYGRYDLYGGNYDKLSESLRRLLELDSMLTVYPGHGETTTIRDEQNTY